jgi:hypothetical protein
VGVSSHGNREQKLATNQALFRDINERIRELALRPGFANGYGLDVVCECSDESCTSMIHVAVDDYERVRAYGDRFLIYPRHEIPQIERIVDRGRGYEIVQKFGDAAAVVRELDPRANGSSTEDA